MKETDNNKKSNGNTILLTIIGIATLLIAVVGTTFAYFNAVVVGNENPPPIRVTSGVLSMHFEGGPAINVQHIYPREESWATKTFSIQGTTDTNVRLYYNISLIINENTFGEDSGRDDVLVFTLEVDSSSSSNGSTIAPISATNIPRVGPVPIGTGHFVGPIEGNATHTYHLRLFFPDRGFNQDAEQGKTFRAHIHVQN